MANLNWEIFGGDNSGTNELITSYPVLPVFLDHLDESAGLYAEHLFTCDTFPSDTYPKTTPNHSLLRMR